MVDALASCIMCPSRSPQRNAVARLLAVDRRAYTQRARWSLLLGRGLCLAHHALRLQRMLGRVLAVDRSIRCIVYVKICGIHAQPP
jgi:hypothetical protein